MNDSTYLMMLHFSKKYNQVRNNTTSKRQNSKVNFNNKVFIEEEIKKPENNQNELKGILKKNKDKYWFVIF